MRNRWIAAALLLSTACGIGSWRPEPTRATGLPRNPDAPDETVLLVGAGDIANCGVPGAEQTASLVETILRETRYRAWVFTLGDHAYFNGTWSDFETCYDPTWGRFRAFTRPVPGNHDYYASRLRFASAVVPAAKGADPYFGYFDTFPGQAGEPGEGWYRYEHGAWTVLALNTGPDGRVEVGGPQWAWLYDQLESLDPSGCSVALLHNPPFVAGPRYRDSEELRPLWNLLTDGGVDVVMAGHEHNYQRFNPRGRDGTADGAGARQFVVGTGGASLRKHKYGPDDARRRGGGMLQSYHADSWGVLELELSPDAYGWRFVDVTGAVIDRGSSPCQNRGRERTP